jgi:hypothetical protein
VEIQGRHFQISDKRASFFNISGWKEDKGYVIEFPARLGPQQQPYYDGFRYPDAFLEFVRKNEKLFGQTDFIGITDELAVELVLTGDIKAQSLEEWKETDKYVEFQTSFDSLQWTVRVYPDTAGDIKRTYGMYDSQGRLIT